MKLKPKLNAKNKIAAVGSLAIGEETQRIDTETKGQEDYRYINNVRIPYIVTTE